VSLTLRGDDCGPANAAPDSALSQLGSALYRRCVLAQGPVGSRAKTPWMVSSHSGWEASPGRERRQ